MPFWKIFEFSKDNITPILIKLDSLEIMGLQMRILTSSLNSDLFCFCQYLSTQPMMAFMLIDPEQPDIQHPGYGMEFHQAGLQSVASMGTTRLIRAR